MTLTIHQYDVHEAIFGSKSSLKDGTITICKNELVSLLLSNTSYEEIDLHLAKPGESCRIVHIMDTVQPRYKENGSAYPGAFSPLQIAGEGETHVLTGFTVMGTGTAEGIQEGMVDMSGPAASLSPFSKTINLVITGRLKEGLSAKEMDTETRKASFLAADYLSKLTVDQTPHERHVMEWKWTELSDLPRIAYIYSLQGQGTYRDTFVYGLTSDGILPTVISPVEIIDGAVTSGNYVIACHKNPTYLHVNHPIIHELLERDGKDLRFAGVILVNEHDTLEDKERSAMLAAKRAKDLMADGVIITEEGGGHADSDLMLNVKACHEIGVRPVAIANETAGENGDLPSLVDFHPTATSVVSTGNNDEMIPTHRVDRLIGSEASSWKDLNTVALARIYASTNQFGVNKLTVNER